MKNIVDIIQSALGRDAFKGVFADFSPSILQLFGLDDNRMPLCMCCCRLEGCC